MSARRAVCNIRALRLLAGCVESAASAQLPAAFGAPQSMGMHITQPLISLRSGCAQAPLRSFASSPIRHQAEPAASPTESEDMYPDMPVFERLPDRIEGPYVVQPRAVFAVVEVGGTQYKVTPDDLIYVEKLSGIDVNDRLRLGRVMLLGSAAETIVGRPYIPGASVTAALEEQVLDGKVIVFKKRRRKNSRRTKGHRQPLTGLRILSIEGIEEGEPPSSA